MYLYAARGEYLGDFGLMEYAGDDQGKPRATLMTESFMRYLDRHRDYFPVGAEKR